MKNCKYMLMFFALFLCFAISLPLSQGKDRRNARSQTKSQNAESTTDVIDYRKLAKGLRNTRITITPEPGKNMILIVSEKTRMRPRGNKWYFYDPGSNSQGTINTGTSTPGVGDFGGGSGDDGPISEECKCEGIGVQLVGDGHKNTLIGGEEVCYEIYGKGEADLIVGGPLEDELYGGDGADTIHAGNCDFVDGGRGVDTICYTGDMNSITVVDDKKEDKLLPASHEDCQ